MFALPTPFTIQNQKQESDHFFETRKMKEVRKINVNKHLSREASLGSSSLGDYHREAPASIPFIWESEPGTPKHKFPERPVPPLTPPPSYLYNTNRRSSSTSSLKPNNLIHNIFPRISSKKSTRETSSCSPIASTPSSPSSSHWSSSSSSDKSLSHSIPPSPALNRRGRRAVSQGLSFDSMGEVEEVEDDEYGGSPVSTLCYRFGPNRGCYSAMMKMLKK